MLRRFLSVSVVLLIPLVAAGAEFGSPRLEAVTSWLGNSYGGAKKWVQQDIAALAVMPDGTLFTNVPWDEAGGNIGEYRDGELIRHALYTHGWGNNGGEAVAANARYLYFAMEVGNERGGLKDPATWPPKGSKWFGISRRPRADIGKAAPFAGGRGGKGNTLKESFLVVAEVADTLKEGLPGLCADERKIYVADPHAAELKVYDAETMQPAGGWKIERAGPLALDATGVLWMLQKRTESAPARFVRYEAAGAVKGAPLTLAAEISATAFCFDPKGRLLVADDGPAQQIRIFSVQGDALAEVGAFGEKGGITGGTPGAVADRKFNHVTAIGCDVKGALYVAQDGQSGGGGTVLESYQLAKGSLNWRLQGLTFVDMADIDRTHDREAFTKEERFQLDYPQPPGKEASYRAFTLAAAKYPQDPRLHVWSAGAWVRTIGGRRVLFVNDMTGSYLQAYRFDGEIAVPAGFFAKKRVKEKTVWPPEQPAAGEWIWRDANGNGAFDVDEYQQNGGGDAPAAQGWWVDQAGNVWLATETKGIRFFPCGGLDAAGNPQWDFKTMQTFPHPEGFREVKRLRYDSATDTLYVGGTTAEARNQHWKPMGPVLARYDGWLRGGRELRWRITLPYAEGTSGHESCEPMGFDVAGEFAFVPYTGASKKAGVKTGRVEVFRLTDGGAVGHLEPGPEVGEVGLQDIRETLTAHRRADGEYVVMIEDDYKAKVVMYRFRPAP